MWLLLRCLSCTSLFYFFYGISAALYLTILFTSKKKTVLAGPLKPFGASSSAPVPNKEQVPIKRIYMNIFFLDRKELIRNIIRSKVPKNMKLIRALAKRAAIALLENGIVERVGKSLCQVVPERLAPLGVVSTCSVAYTQQAFICLEISLFGLSLQKMLATNAGPEKAENIMGFLNRYALPAVTDWAARFMLLLIADKLMTGLPMQMKDKMYNKMNAELEIITCTEEEQGPFLVQTIHQLESVQQAPESGGASSGERTTSTATSSA